VTEVGCMALVYGSPTCNRACNFFCCACIYYDHFLTSSSFAIYQLRTSYLANIHDGVGERLITVNSAILNDPAFKAAGWAPDPAELKRTYSPPIPTAVTSEYFQARPLSAGVAASGLGEDEEEGGMVTGGGVGSGDTVGPVLISRRRRRKEQLEEDDSSDLSDESDEELEGAQRPAHQVRFGKMPVRERASSSPVPSSTRQDGPSLLVTSPSRPPENGRLRQNSLGAVEAVRTRTRRDTTTSSEISSENELDPSVFRRKQITIKASIKDGKTLADHIKDGNFETEETVLEPDDRDDEVDSDDISLASGFSETMHSTSLLAGVGGSNQSSPLVNMTISRPMTPRSPSPKKSKQAPEKLQDLPPPRPISTMQPVSALAMAIKARNTKPVSPFERFATLLVTRDENPLYVKIYVPSSAQPNTPFELLIRKSSNDGMPITVADAIGSSLWRYAEEKLQPPVEDAKMNVNWWTFRIVEDGEVDFDFPALSHTRPILDFTSNNNRAARGRARSKPWDEFALVEATDAQMKENEDNTPIFSQQAAAVVTVDNEIDVSPLVSQNPESLMSPAIGTRSNLVNGLMAINEAFRKDNYFALDAPVTPASHATPRTGTAKALNIHFLDNDFNPRVIPLEVTTDTYFAEVFDQICKMLNVDKALFVLKVTNTTTIAPTDRTVEALGPDRSSLDLTRRRFIGDGAFGLSGSPGSTSPNAPLLLTSAGTLKKARKGNILHPLAQDAIGLGLVGGINANYRRYNVIRKQPMSFAPSHQRSLALDGDYMHIMPSDTGKERVFDAAQGKTTTIHFSSVVGCKVNRKNPRTFRVVVFKERETKRYDFEASSADEASEIVHEIKRGIEPFRATMHP